MTYYISQAKLAWKMLPLGYGQRTPSKRMREPFKIMTDKEQMREYLASLATRTDEMLEIRFSEATPPYGRTYAIIEIEPVTPDITFMPVVDI